MEREDALIKLQGLSGKNLHDLAKQYGITVSTPGGTVNKGWAGHVCERYLGVPMNSFQNPDFGSWELKSIPLKYGRNGALNFKETMAITMINPSQVMQTPFEESHLLSKLQKAVCIARTVGDNFHHPTYVHSVTAIDLDGALYEAVKRDYETVQECLRDGLRGFSALSGTMGEYIQPRTKGAGHGSISRAFYARPKFLEKFIKLD